MENKEIIKYEGGLIKSVGNAINISTKLLNIDFRKINAIYFDDHKIYISGMSTHLKKYFPNLILKTFTHSEPALQCIDKFFKDGTNVDLIITGFNQIGDINGYEFANIIRKKEKIYKKKTVILLVTMYNEEYPVIAKGLKEKTFDKYFTKATGEEIINEIKNLVK
ncbi:hypothetical protein [Ferruginibacter sp.]|nr:hypothetical protein [Ferruginibacter sp.]